MVKNLNRIELEKLCVNDGLVRGPFGGTLKKEIFVKRGYKVYEQKNAIYRNCNLGDYYIDEEKYIELSRFKIKYGDFIISCSGTIGRIYRIPVNAKEGVINQALLKITIDENKCNSTYFYKYFEWDKFQKEITDDTQGGAMKNLVGMDVFKNTLILLPELKEQKAIVEALTDIDNLIFSLEKLIEKKKALKQGAIQELLEGKSRLGGFIEEWIDTTIGQVCDVFDGTHQTPRYVEKGIPFYSVENVTNNEFKNVKYISLEEHEFLTKSRHIERGDVFMTRIGSIGVCKYIDWDVNASYYVSLALIKCKKIYPKFLVAYSFTRSFQNEIELNSLPSATPKKINLGPISEIKMSIPKTEEEQIILANIVFDLESEIASLELKLLKYRNIKQGMMQELLTGKIRLI